MSFTNSLDDQRAFQRVRASLVRELLQFSSQHPEAAARLERGGYGANDPQLGLLIDSMALLVSRTEKKFDQAWPGFVASAFESIAPGYSDPIPSVAMFAASADGLNDVVKLAKNTRLKLSDAQGRSAVFHACGDQSLLPLRVTAMTWVSAESPEARPASLNGQAAMRIDLVTTHRKKELTFTAADLPIRLHAVSPGPRLPGLIDALLVAPNAVITNTDGVDLASASIEALGFLRDEVLLPASPAQPSGELLAQDYFLLPEKYAGVQIRFDGRIVDGCQVWIPMPAAPAGFVSGLALLQTNVFPAVNLFEETVELEIPQKRLSQPIRLPAAGTRVDVHRVLSVSRLGNKLPIASIHDSAAWSIPNQAAERWQCVWTGKSPELMVTNAASTERRDRFYRVTVRCSNGDLPASMAGTLKWQTMTGVIRGVSLTQPTPMLTPPNNGPHAASRQVMADALGVAGADHASLLSQLLDSASRSDWDADAAYSRQVFLRRQVIGRLLSSIKTVQVQRGRRALPPSGQIPASVIRERRVEVSVDGIPVEFQPLVRILGEFLNQFRPMGSSLMLRLQSGNEAFQWQSKLEWT